MIKLLNDLYIFIISGVAISFLIAVLFVWYCVHKDMKEREAFDETLKISGIDKFTKNLKI
jgi:hypothetical protein